jgi:hypothetical protein
VEIVFLTSRGVVDGREFPDDWLHELQRRCKSGGLAGTAQALNQLLATGGQVSIPPDEETGLALLLTNWIDSLPLDTRLGAREALERLRNALRPDN